MALSPAASPRSPWFPAAFLLLVLLTAACQDAGVDPLPLPGSVGDASATAVMLPEGKVSLSPALGVIGAAPTATCGPRTVARLLEVGGGPLGTVEIATDPASVYVTFRTAGDPERPLVYTGVAVAGSKEALPFRSSGAPDVRAFPVSPPHPPGSDVITWRIPRVVAPGEEVFVSVFARVGDVAAWAEGTRIADPGVPHTTYLVHAGHGCEGGPIGEDGGTVSSPDDQAVVTVPADALSEPVQITIEPATTSLENAVPGTTWEFGPEGTTFAEPVTMRLAFDPTRIPEGITQDRLRLARIVGGRAEVVAGSGIVPGENAVEGRISGFSTWTIVWVPQADLEVLGPIDFSPSTAVAGQPLEVTAGLRNLSTSVTAENVTLQFRFQGAVFTAAYADRHPEGCTSDEDPVVQIVTCVMDLAPGGSAARTITVNPWLAGTSINVTAQSGVPIGLQDPVFGNNSASASIAVVSATSADVALALDPAATLTSLGGDLIEISGEVRYVQSAQETLDGAGVQVEIAGSVVVEDLEPGCSFAARAEGIGVVVGCFGEVSAGNPLPFRVRVRSNAAPQSVPVTMTAVPPFGFTDPNPGNNSQTRTYQVEARTTDLSILQFVVDRASAVVGEEMLYTFTGQNLGPDPLPESRLQFRILSGGTVSPLQTLPADCTDVSSLVVDAVAVDCVFGPLSGEDAVTPTRSIWVTPTAAGQALEASVEYRVPAITSDPNLANNRSELSTPVPGAQADIRTTIISDPQVARGFVPVTASVIVTNTTISGVTSVSVPEMMVDLVIEGGVADVSVPPQCQLQFILGSQRSYACTVPGLDVGIATVFDVVFTPTALDQVIRVVATPQIPDGIEDPFPDNNTGVVEVPVQPRSADLSIFSFTDTPDPSPPGEGIGYAVRVRSAPASLDVLPLARLELRFTGDVEFNLSTTPCTNASQLFSEDVVLLCDIGPLAPGGEILFSAFLRALSPNQVISATAEIKPFADAVDPVPGNNLAVQTTTVTGTAAAARVYVGNLGSQSVSVLDASTDAVASTIATTGGPFKLTRRPGSTEVWAANVTGTTRTVQVISTTTDAIVATVPLPAGTSPRDIAFSPDGATAWVVDIGSHRLVEINASTRGVVATLPMPPAPLSMVVSPDGATGYVAATTDTVSFVDLAARSITSKLGGFGNTGGVVLSDDGGSLVVLADNELVQSRVVRVATGTAAVSGSVTVGGNLNGVVTNATGSEAWVVDAQSFRLFRVDFGATTSTSLNQFAWAPWALAWSPDRSAFWVTFRDTNQVGRFDATTLAEEWRTPVGSQPVTIVVPDS